MEILVTVSLSGLLMCLGFTSFVTLTKQEYSQSALQQVSYTINKARSYARSQGYDVQLIFNAGSNTYSIMANGINLVSNTNFDETSGVLPDTTKIISNNCSNIYFYIDGSLVDNNNNPLANNCQITVGYANGPQSNVIINANTGVLSNG